MPEAPAIRYLVLGPLDAVGNGEPVPLGGPKQRAVLGMLISRVGQPVTNDQLVDGIWGSNPPNEVRASLHSYVSNLRTGVGADIERSGGGYVLNVDPEAVDAVEFERLTDEGRQSVSANPDRASERLREGLGLWRGKPYADLLEIEGLQAEIRRLEELRLAAVESRIDADLALGRHQVLTGELAALAAEYPLRERFQSQLMVALYRDGRQSEALRAFQRTRDYLREELGVDPSPELQDLELRILNHDPDLLTIRDTVTEHVALLFTDITGSTELWETRATAMRAALARHDGILSAAIDGAGGRLFKHTGDGMMAAFPTVVAATNAAVDAQRSLQASDWGDLDLQVRMGVDVGEVDARGGDYFGPLMNRGTRIMSAAHGGQILLSEEAQLALSAEPGIQLRSLGEHRLKGLGAPVRVFQLVVEGLPVDFPDLRIDAATAGPSRQFGDAIRGYEVRERLSAGRISVVYRAFQPTVGREVAVKVIRPEYANHPSFVRRFESEARMVAGLEHPHIVSLYDYWRDADGAYLVMPLMAGGSLADKNLGALSLDRVVGVVGQVGSALGYAHRQGVIHRDIKPSNILLDADGNAYLADFGIAIRDVEREAGIQSDSAIHRAPEDRTGAAVDERSDVYSLASVVAGLLTGSGRATPDLTTLDGPLERLLESALAEDPSLRPETVDSFVGRLGALNGGMTVSAEPIVSRNPYKGLRPFDVDDARDFFGRDLEIRRLIELVGDNRMVTVVGPSGSGKSSLVRAGMMPALAKGALAGSDKWLTVTTLPGSHPFDELASVLGEVATESMGDMAAELASDDHGLLRLSKRLMRDLEGELVLVIDQFEELYTVVTSDDVRGSFIRNLIEATSEARSRVRVVLTLRADFYDHPLGDELLGPIVSEANLALAVPKPAELRQTIERPAANAGVTFEDGLTDQLLADVQEQPGSLPLMQFSLAALVAQSLDGRVSIADYERLGGVSGALTQRADDVYRSLGEEEQAVAEEVFMRLVSVSEEADDVRRRVRQSELESLDLEAGHVAEILHKFGEARLLTFDRDPLTRGPTVEVAHEALLRSWARFRGWLDARRESLILHRRFRAAESEWQQSSRDDAYLLTGGRLSQFEAWAAGSDAVLTPDETGFLTSCVGARDQAEARRKRIRRGVLAGFGVAALVAVMLAVAAWVQRSEAEDARSLAVAREWILEADRNIPVDPELSIGLALEAIDAYQAANEAVPGNVIDVLRRATTENRTIARLVGGAFVAVSGDGTLIATKPENGVGVIVTDWATGEMIAEFGDGEVLNAAFNPLDNGLIVTTEDRPTQIRRGGSWQEEITELDIFGRWISLSPDGALVAVQSDERILAVYDYRSGERLFGTEASSVAPAITSDGKLAFAPADGLSNGRIVDITTGEAVDLDLPFTGAGFGFSPDGGRLAFTDQADMAVIDVASGTVVWSRSDITRPALPVWLEDGEGILVGGESTLSVRDASTGDALVELPGHTGGSFSYDQVPGTELIVSAGLFDNQTLVLDIGPATPSEVTRMTSELPVPFLLEPGADGETVEVTSFINGQESALISASTGRIISRDGFAPDLAAFTHPTRSPGGGYVGVIDENGLAHVRSTEDGSIRYTAPAGWVIRAVSADARLVLEYQYAEDDARARLVSTTGDTSIDLETSVEVNFASFSSDGRYLLITGFGEWVQLFETTDGTLLNQIDAGAEVFGNLAFRSALSPGGERVAVGRSSGLIDVYDVSALAAGASAEGAREHTLAAHDAFIIRVEFSPEGKLLASVSWDEPAKVWDVKTGLRLGEFGTPNESSIVAFGFHQTEPWFYASMPGDVIATYTLDIDELVTLAEASRTRELTEDECQQYLRQPCEDS